MTPGGIRTHNRSRRAAEDLRLRPRGHWDRPSRYLVRYAFHYGLLLLTDSIFVAVNTS